VLDGGPLAPRKRRFRVELSSKNMQLQIAAATRRIGTRRDSAFSLITLDLLRLNIHLHLFRPGYAHVARQISRLLVYAQSHNELRRRNQRSK